MTPPSTSAHSRNVGTAVCARGRVWGAGRYLGTSGLGRSLRRVPETVSVMVLGFVLGASAFAQEPARPGASDLEGDVDRPNLVVVVVDDASFTDFGAYGSEVRTPTIDRLAARGVRFTNFHTSPMCSPTRAMLLTGVDSHTAGIGSLYEATPRHMRGEPGYGGQLRPEVVTVASLLQDAGYRTYMTGKWNLGHTPENLPSARGFDRTFALDATGADNYEKKSYLPLYDDVPWFADGEPTELPDDFYSSEFFVDRMISFLEEDRGAEEPFFAYVAFQAIHIPLQVPREFSRRYDGVYDRGWEWLRAERAQRAMNAGVFPGFSEPAALPAQRDWESVPEEERALFAKSMEVQAGMLEAMDHHLGRLVAYLEQIGAFDNTVFMVLSDNGPEAGDPASRGPFRLWMRSVGYSRDVETLGEPGSYAFIGADFAAATAGPLAYYKFHGGEGGMRVPLIVAGPGVASSPYGHGATAAAFTFVADIAPTLLDLAGAAPPEDGPPWIGASLRPALGSPGAALVHADTEAICFETAGHAGVFKGVYKLVRVGRPAGDGVWRLYDLGGDPGETTDLSEAAPELFATMRADYEAYARRVGVIELPADYSPLQQLDAATLDAYRGRLTTAALAAVLLVLAAGFLAWRRLTRAALEDWPT